jgi:hypothetical protein
MYAQLFKESVGILSSKEVMESLARSMVNWRNIAIELIGPLGAPFQAKKSKRAIAWLRQSGTDLGSSGSQAQ